MIPRSEPRSRFVAAIEAPEAGATRGGALVARALVEGDRLPLAGALDAPPPGTIVLVRRELDAAGDRAVRVLRVLADPGTALAELHRLAAERGIDAAFPDAVIGEVDAWARAPRIDDPALVDLEALPFVTIDGASSRDLDQAIHVAPRAARGREGVGGTDGWTVRYAIADASTYVPRGSALWEESLRRGASYYLPGLSLPMLPRALSEGLVSLNPGVARRALVFEMQLDARGHSIATRLVRARVRSRAKLSFEAVQQLFDEPGASPLAGGDVEASLRAMAAAARARLAEAAERDVVRYRRVEVDVTLEGARGERFVVLDGVRREVELWNEQISLLCNAEGARLLAESDAPSLRPIYRVHPPPEPERVESLRARIARIVETHGLDARAWAWDEGRTSLAVYVASLPQGGPNARVARAIQRQAILTNVRSRYATEPGAHHGVGLDPYARFSAPMREVVGVYLHAEAIEMMAAERAARGARGVRGAGAEAGRDAEEGADAIAEEEALRDRVVDAANRAKETQRALTDLVNRRVIDRLFEPELARPRSERCAWSGTVMGISGAKLHVQLDRPAIDVKIYLRDLAERWGGAWLEADELGVVLRERESGRVRAIVGDAIAVRVVRRDAQRDRWVLEAVALGAGAEEAGT